MATFWYILAGFGCFAFGFFIHALLVAASEKSPDMDIYEDESVKQN